MLGLSTSLCLLRKVDVDVHYVNMCCDNWQDTFENGMYEIQLWLHLII